MYRSILPDLSGKTLLDVGSRLGAVLYVVRERTVNIKWLLCSEEHICSLWYMRLLASYTVLISIFTFIHTKIGMEIGTGYEVVWRAIPYYLPAMIIAQLS